MACLVHGFKITNRSSHDRDRRGRKKLFQCLHHLLSAGNGNIFNTTARTGKRIRATDEGNLCAPLVCGSGQGKSHFPGRSIADISNGIKILPGRPGRNKNLALAQRAFPSQPLHDTVDNIFDRGQSPLPALSTGHFTHGRFDNSYLLFFQ